MARTCLWMDAGVLSYRLCDRGFDCEHCPLDAALRGRTPTMALRGPARGASAGRGAAAFPDDRLYTTGHTWIKPLESQAGRLFVGLDSFAAALIVGLLRLAWTTSRRPLRSGEPICQLELELGRLPLRLPFDARVCRRNRSLDEDPAALIDAPYDEGWIGEVAFGESSDLDGLLVAEAARKQTHLDVKRFRRRLAMMLLSTEHDSGALAGDEAPARKGLGQLLGGARYLALIRELIC